MGFANWSSLDLPTGLDNFFRESRPFSGVSPKWKIKVKGNISKPKSLNPEQVHFNVDTPSNSGAIICLSMVEKCNKYNNCSQIIVKSHFWYTVGDHPQHILSLFHKCLGFKVSDWIRYEITSYRVIFWWNFRWWHFIWWQYEIFIPITSHRMKLVHTRSISIQSG